VEIIALAVLIDDDGMSFSPLLSFLEVGEVSQTFPFLFKRVPELELAIITLLSPPSTKLPTNLIPVVCTTYFLGGFLSEASFVLNIILFNIETVDIDAACPFTFFNYARAVSDT
jgi:hypothetical protein